MTVKCRNCPLRRYKVFEPMTEREIAFMERFKTGEMVVDPGTDILLEGARSPQLFTVLDGMGLRYKTLASGERQVINFVMPGDFLGLQSSVMKEMQHSVQSTTAMTLCVFARTEVWSVFTSSPERGFDLTWIAARQEHFLGEALATVGQRTGMERVAWGLVQLFHRGRELNLTSGRTMPLPYRQQDLADALGLSLVHTNKTLKKLRDRKLASWQDGVLTVNDPDALAEIAGLEPHETMVLPLF